MRIHNHLKKIERLGRSASKLDFEEDYEALVEIYMLISAHYINAALHKLGVVKQNKDIKHNQIFSFLKEGNKLGEDTEIIRDSMKKLDGLRPSHVYGKGENGEIAKNAEGYCKEVKEICSRIIKENEGTINEG
nr:hypothetical protein [Nanoarchaeum sp.]